MKFKNEENVNYIIDTNDDDTVGFVKKELSKCISIKSTDIVLVSRNRILDDKMSLREYEIGADEFVMFYLRIDYMVNTIMRILNRGQPNQSRIPPNQSAADTSHCSVLSDRGNDSSTLPAQGHFIPRKDNDGGCWTSLECVNCDYEIRKFCLHNQNNIMEDLLQFLSDELDVPAVNIKLFKDRALTNPITSVTDIKKLIRIKKSEGIAIYYKLIADIDDFIKLELLGRGTFGSVYKCLELGSKQNFALKKFNIPRKESKKYEKLSTEIDVLCLLGSHPRIVQFERKIDCDDALYIVMEYIPGGSLGQYCRRNGSLPEREISQLSKQILEAVEYLHKKRVLHRDIKGDNILLSEDGFVKLCDFGLAKSLVELASEDLLNGVVQSSVGTANWIAPEVIHGEKYGISADIWSFGATVVEMATGKPPFQNMTMFQIIYKIGQDRKMEFNEPEHLSDAMRDFINLCAQPNPSDRPTASKLLQHDFITGFRDIN